MREEFLWVEKYRPKTIEECILPRGLKKSFREFVDNQEIPNLLLCGTAGIGKTTVARALCEQLNTDYILIITARNSEFKGIAEKCLVDNNIRYDRIIYDTPRGERILINDRKPWVGGIDTAYSFNIDRNNFDL